MKIYNLCHILQSYMPQKLPHFMYNHQIFHRHEAVVDPSLQNMLTLMGHFSAQRSMVKQRSSMKNDHFVILSVICTYMKSDHM